MYSLHVIPTRPNFYHNSAMTNLGVDCVAGLPLVFGGTPAPCTALHRTNAHAAPSKNLDLPNAATTWLLGKDGKRTMVTHL